MELFISSKIVGAIAMKRQEFVEYRYPGQPANQAAGDPDDAGYLVEYMDGGKPNDERHAGYISWCPKEQFDNANVAIGEVSDRPAFLQRLHGEIAQNQDRLTKLKAFIQAAGFQKLDTQSQTLMLKQSDLMTQLDAVLIERLDLLTQAKGE